MSKQASKGNIPTSLKREVALALSERIENLVKEMHDCIDTKRPVDLSTPPHVEITEALHRLVYEQGNPAQLQVIYGDNSKGDPFPVRCLPLPTTLLPWNERRAIAIGTLTFRHVDYDDYIDRYLIRDRETRAMTNREIELRAFERMTEILEDPYLHTQSFLAIYQTGLEPLIVGLYRAIVKHLQTRYSSRMEQMAIQPIFFAGKGRRSKDAEGTRWG